MQLIPQNTEVFEDSIIVNLRTNCEIKNMTANTVKELPVTLADIKRESWEDEFIQSIKIFNVLEVYSLCDDFLLYNDSKVTTKKNPHETLGEEPYESLMCCYVYWPNMDKDIADMMESCKGCPLAAKPWPNRPSMTEISCEFCW